MRDKVKSNLQKIQNKYAGTKRPRDYDERHRRRNEEDCDDQSYDDEEGSLKDFISSDDSDAVQIRKKI